MARILVVDDEPFNRILLEQELSDAGYQVIAASSGASALELLQGGEIDLVLLDIMMPGVDGQEVLRRIRAKASQADLPVIMVSARDQTEDVVRSFGLGANDYVVKPIDMDVLFSRVRTQVKLRSLVQQREEIMRIVSHDLRAPLMNIMGYAKILRDRKFDAIPDEDTRSYINQMDDNAGMMERIISDLMDLQWVENRPFPADLEDVDLNEIAGSVVDMNGNYAESKQIELKLERSHGLPGIQVDPQRIQTVVQNLVVNAIKYCNAGDAAVVRTMGEEKELRLEVEDTGPGIPEAELNRVFERYAQLSNRPTGGEKSYGMGLSICKKLIESHQGRIGVFNNERGGATFWFTLPVKERNPAAVSEANDE